MFCPSQAMANAELLGVMIGMAVERMVTTSRTNDIHLPPENIYFIGFSMGCQVAHFAAEHLKSRDMKIKRLTALDPARFHTLTHPNLQVNETDADFVDVIHTSALDAEPWVKLEWTVVWNAGRVGMIQPIGQVDFYPNGGGYQPVCNIAGKKAVFSGIRGIMTAMVCHHSQALYYFLRSFDTDMHCEYHSYPCYGLQHPDKLPHEVCEKPIDKSDEQIVREKSRMGYHAIEYANTAYQTQLLLTASDEEEKQCETSHPCATGYCSNEYWIYERFYGEDNHSDFVWPACRRSKRC
jgi:triacylglycerol esterase/lipase EstA (alpha/beta hydrolase family)